MMLIICALLIAAPVRAPALDAPASDPASPPPALPFLTLSLGPELGARRVTYRDRISTGLASYQSGTLGLVRLAAQLYPSSGKGLPVVSDIGLFGSTSRSLRAEAQFAPGTTFEDQWHAWDVGARWRGIFAGEEWGSLSISYGSLSSELSGPPLYAVLLPSGTLQYWRPGLDIRFPLGPISLSICGGYLAVVVQDAIGHAFPRSSVGGLDLGGALAYSLNSRMELRLDGKYTRFFYTLNPLPGDPFVAGGALDEYVVAELAFTLRV
jgi:hypothetical protein